MSRLKTLRCISVVIALITVILIYACAVQPKAATYEFGDILQEKKEIKESVKTPVETPQTEDVYVNFWEIYSSLDWVTWEDCLKKASEIGMDEWTLRIATGWTVNECYTFYDPYLAFLCAMCPLYYWARGEYVPDGLAGFDHSGMYSEGNLLWQSYNVSQEELRIVYMSLSYPRYDIFGCDGLSWYWNCIYENYIGGYTIRVWAE